MKRCNCCGQKRPDASYSDTFGCIICDECFTDANDAREEENITSCYPVNE